MKEITLSNLRKIIPSQQKLQQKNPKKQQQQQGQPHYRNDKNLEIMSGNHCPNIVRP